MKKENLLATLGAAYLLSACSPAYEKYPTLKPEDKIMAFGDSLTYGYGGNSKTYPDTLAQLSNYEVVNYGVNGNTTSDGLRRIQESLEKEKPKLVILSLGGNDVLRSVPKQVIKDNLKKMVSIIKQHNAQVVLLAEPAPNALSLFQGRPTGLEDALVYEEIAKEENLLNIKNVYSTLLSENEYRSDPIHLNGKGYEKAGEMIFNELKEAKIL